MAFKVVVADPKTGKSYQKEVEADLTGKRVGETIEGSLVGLTGYQLEITGGSDIIGNPMRRDTDGAMPRRLLLSGGVGFNPSRKGERAKKRVIGRVISGSISQVNTKVVKAGAEALDKVWGKSDGKEDEGTTDAPAEETKVEEVKEEPKVEEVKEEPKVEEAPKEEKVEETPKEEEKKPEEA